MPKVRRRGCRLPLELVDACYRLLFHEAYFDPGVVVEKPAWRDIAGLTTASKVSRNVILALWFHVLRIGDVKDWAVVLCKWKRLFLWTRAIHYTRDAYKSPRRCLEPFRRVQTLRIDLPAAHVTAHGPFDFEAPQIAQIIRRGASSAIQHLEIRGITWLLPAVLCHIADGLPSLRTLRLRQPLVLCALCNCIAAPAFASVPPARIVYDGGLGLPADYARSLASLRHLHTVVITALCGVGSAEYHSLFSYPATTTAPASSAPQNARAHHQIGWSGECAACMRRLRADEVLRDSWRARVATSLSHAAAAHSRDRKRPGPPSLRRVEWILLEPSDENWPGDLLPTMPHVVHVAH